MGGQELTQTFAVGQPEADELHRAAIHLADRVAAEHPHELDGTMPRLAGRLLGRDPLVAAGLLELLDALGIRTAARRAS